jgi:hypothetical protein
MKSFYYIAKRKVRGYLERYAGDGIIDAETAKEARQIVAARYGVAANRVKLTEKKD